MSHRAENVLGHLSKSVSSQPTEQKETSGHSPLGKNPDDVVVVTSLRTPIGKANRGNLKDTPSLSLLVPVLKGVLEKTGVDPDQVDDIVVGNVRGIGLHRQAAYLAGFGDKTCVRSINRACSSGLQAVADVAAAISSGYYEIGIAAGVESMSLDQFAPVKPEAFKLARQRIEGNQSAVDCLIPMGITSENVAEDFGVTRREQDELAVISHARAHAAKDRFQEEIIPVETTVKDKMSGEIKHVVVKHDEGIRPGSKIEKLLKLKPAFKKGGTTTAGNSSQVSDGAAAALLMKRSKANELGLPIQGVFRSFAVRGVPPRIMGIGPAFAIPAALEAAGLTTDDIDLYEINEAFASQAVYCVQKLGLKWDNVNVNGGAIALGHPLGCTGCRMTATLLHEMRRRGDRFGVVSMCIGSGQGAAAVYEVEY